MYPALTAAPEAAPVPPRGSFDSWIDFLGFGVEESDFQRQVADARALISEGKRLVLIGNLVGGGHGRPKTGCGRPGRPLAAMNRDSDVQRRELRELGVRFAAGDFH